MPLQGFDTWDDGMHAKWDRIRTMPPYLRPWMTTFIWQQGTWGTTIPGGGIKSSAHTIFKYCWPLICYLRLGLGQDTVSYYFDKITDVF